MTDAEWLAATEPARVLEFLRDRASDRKLRLFAAACFRQFWRMMGERKCHSAGELAEQYADGELDFAQLGRIRSRLVTNRYDYNVSSASQAVRAVLHDSASSAADGTLRAVWYFRYPFESAALQGSTATQAPSTKQLDRQAVLGSLQCLFGNLSPTTAADPSWRTSTVIALSNGIYADSAFDRLPILGDALQDAGCDNNGVLNHCRGNGPHVRGCWVVDLLLGKA